jgi:hypothetical protein
MTDAGNNTAIIRSAECREVSEFPVEANYDVVAQIKPDEVKQLREADAALPVGTFHGDEADKDQPIPPGTFHTE